jgi:hypothetical protein
MAGGLLPGKPFEFNLKCILFTAVLAGGYWYLPPKRLWILVFLLWFPYIALAWYDWSYGCQSKLMPTAVPFGRYVWLPFKPPGYKQAYEDLPVEKKAIMDRVDHLAGWTIVAGAVGYYLLRKK